MVILGGPIVGRPNFFIFFPDKDPLNCIAQITEVPSPMEYIMSLSQLEYPHGPLLVTGLRMVMGPSLNQ